MPLGVPQVTFQFLEEIESFWVDLYNRLYRDRALFLSTILDDEVTNQLIGIMQFLNEESSLLNQSLYINSMGGSLVCGLSVSDIMRGMNPLVYTMCIGCASSMASFLLCLGDIRCGLAHSKMMIHQPATGLDGQTLDVELESGLVDVYRSKVCKTYSRTLGLTHDMVVKAMNRDTFMTVQESMKYGIIDHLITGFFELNDLINNDPLPLKREKFDFKYLENLIKQETLVCV